MNDRTEEPQNAEQTPAEKPTGIPYIEILFGAQKGKRYVIDDSEVTVGRSPDSNFVVDDPLVSRKHLALLHGPEGLVIQDRGSVNGFRVQGKRTEHALLKEGDVIELGSTVVVLKYGEAPVSSPAYPPTNIGRTQRMPTLRQPAPEPEDPSEVPMELPEGAPIPAPKGGVRRWVQTPRSPWFIRIVSWSVVLILTMGGILLFTELLDTSPGVSLTKSTAIAEEDGANSPELRKRIRLPIPSNLPGSLHDSPVDDTPDVAEDSFLEAQTLEEKGQFSDSLTIYREIARRYPEFTPANGQPIAEHVDRVEKTLQFEKAVGVGRELLDSNSRDHAAMAQAIQNLAQIPTTNGLFGEKAMYLAERLRSRVRQLEHGFIEEEPELNNDPSTLEGDIKEDAAPTGEESNATPAEAKARNTDQAAGKKAQQKARYLYSKGQFTRTVVVLQEGARLSDSPRQARDLNSLAAQVQRFAKDYETANNLLGIPGKELEALEALSSAISKDQKLFKEHTSALRKKGASTHATLSKRYFDGSSYIAARKHLDSALDMDPTLEEGKKLSSLYSFKAGELLKKAQDTANIPEALEMVSQAKALAGPNGPVGKEAVHLEADLKERVQ